MRRWTMLAVAATLAACAPGVDVGGDNSNMATSAGDAVALKATTALSLAELAYNTGEAAATAALESGQLSKTQATALGDAVHRARAYRDQARALVAAGGDASPVIEALDAALIQIHTLSGR